MIAYIKLFEKQNLKRAYAVHKRRLKAPLAARLLIIPASPSCFQLASRVSAPITYIAKSRIPRQTLLVASRREISRAIKKKKKREGPNDK